MARRIDKIMLFSEASGWYYCPTDLNSADVASRPYKARNRPQETCSFKDRNFYRRNVKFLLQIGMLTLLLAVSLTVV